MWTRSVFRATAPLKRSIRGHASQASRAGGGGIAEYAAAAALVGGGGYYWYSRQIRRPELADTPPPPGQQVNVKEEGAPTSASDALTFTGGGQDFVSLKLESVEIINHNTKKFRFALPDKDQTSGLPITSAIITRYKGPEMEKPVIRPYTPTSDEDAKGYMDLVIKRYPNGPMSEHMHDMTPGQRLDVKGPIPKYPWSANKHEHIVLIAGGTGITPMWQLARSIFKNPEDKTKVTLVYGNITEEDILLKKDLNELENTYPRRFRAFYVLDKPPEGWSQGKGYITKDLLKQVMPEPKETNLKIFVCGPPGLYSAVSGNKKSPQDQGELTGILKELGYSQDQVYKF